MEKMMTKRKEVNKNNNGGDEQDDIDFDDLCEYKGT